MKRLGIALALTSLLLVGLGLGWLLPNPWRAPSQLTPEQVATAVSTPVARVIAQGKLQPIGGVVNVFAPPGVKISELLVAEGAAVEAGRELLRYTGQRSLELQVALAASRTGDLKLELQQQLLAAEGSVTSAKAAAQSAELNLEQAAVEPALTTERDRLELARQRLKGLQQLAEDPDTQQLISPLTVAEQKLELETAERELQRAERKLEATKQSLHLALDVSRQNLEAAEKVLELARQALNATRSAELSEQIAEQQLSESRLMAPVSGQVLRVMARQGEAVGAAPVMQLGAVGTLECLAEVNDSLVGKVKLGQPCKILSPALPRPLRGTVSEIGRFVGTPALRDPDPLALVDRRAVEVKIAISSDDVPAAKDLLNLQVTVEIELETR
jgi:HlyD family secretion protein